MNEELWTPVGSNLKLHTHNKEVCKGRPCCVHNPSDHHMKDWPQLYRDDRGFTERICEHGVGHPDPDSTFPENDIRRVHGCDGCCCKKL